MIRLYGFVLAIAAVFPARANQFPLFPEGTVQFFRKTPAAAIPADGGGIWAALPEGIVRYTPAGGDTILPIPGGTAYRLAKGDGNSVWFANAGGVGRISTTGTLLEFHAISQIRDIAVASDGALWYATSGKSVGRIAGTTVDTFTAPDSVWSLARASDGAIWLLGTGIGSSTDVIYRMSRDGTVITLALGADVLFGRLQTVADGTLYVGTGYRNELLRIRPGATTIERIPQVSDSMFLVDDAHNIWSASYTDLNYLSHEGVRFTVNLPYDPRNAMCMNIPVWVYEPLAVDSSGRLWLRVFDDGVSLPLPIPCPLPEPPEMPTLIAIDMATLVAAHTASIPALTDPSLIALAAMIAVVGALRLLRR